ncbi:MAG: hypothetical protein OXB88_05505 [Bacteriovoracales bacterium]|nr:hypothetical protein [Bacteriovoracales bacterium]
MKVGFFLLLCGLVAVNIYQYRSYRFLEEKHRHFKLAETWRKGEALRGQKPGRRGVSKALVGMRDNRKERGDWDADEVVTTVSASGMDSLLSPGEEDFLEEMEEDQRDKDEDMRRFFLDELSLEEEDYQFYQKSVESFKEGQAEAHNFFARNARENGTPYLPSFEERKAALQIQEKIFDLLAKRFGREKLRQITEYERQLGQRQLEEKGHYIPYGLSQ